MIFLASPLSDVHWNELVPALMTFLGFAWMGWRIARRSGWFGGTFVMVLFMMLGFFAAILVSFLPVFQSSNRKY